MYKMGEVFKISGANFSECGTYRYSLFRTWDTKLPKAMCIGLNPSTASAVKNDPTITNLAAMLKRLGYGGFYMMNLFAIISPKPEVILTCSDPIGENEKHLELVSRICQDVIFCWGNFKQAEKRILEVAPRYPNAKCFGKNKNGTPCHPLAMMYAGTVKTAKLEKYFV